MVGAPIRGIYKVLSFGVVPCFACRAKLCGEEMSTHEGWRQRKAEVSDHVRFSQALITSIIFISQHILPTLRQNSLVDG
jgi:hypothetical protein